MLKLGNDMRYDYNSAYDILYLTLEETDDYYGHEDEYGIIVNYDYKTRQIVGADIWDFAVRMQSGSDIRLPFAVDLAEIYKQIKQMA